RGSVHAKPLCGQATDVDKPDLRHLKIDDAHCRARLAERKMPAGALDGGDHAEFAIAAVTVLHHIEIARLEDSERQQPLREDHRLKRKQGQYPCMCCSIQIAFSRIKTQQGRTRTRQSPSSLTINIMPWCLLYDILSIEFALKNGKIAVNS